MGKEPRTNLVLVFVVEYPYVPLVSNIDKHDLVFKQSNVRAVGSKIEKKGTARNLIITVQGALRSRHTMPWVLKVISQTALNVVPKKSVTLSAMDCG